MTGNGILQIILYIAALLLLAKPLGTFMARVYQGKSTGLDRVLGPVERWIYRLAGVRPDSEMNWKTYAVAMLLFNFLGILVVYAVQRLQGILPFNPQHLAAVTPDSKRRRIAKSIRRRALACGLCGASSTARR